MKTLFKSRKFDFKRSFVLIVALIGAIYGCRKEISNNGGPSKIVITDPAIADAKSWYENAYPKSGTKEQVLHTNSTAEIDISEVVKPYWQDAERYERLGKEVIEIPVDSAAKFGLALKADNWHTNSAYSRSYYLVIKDSTGYDAYILTVIADSVYVKNDLSKLSHNTYRKHDADFSGLVLYSTPNGEYLGGYTYKDGQLLNPDIATQTASPSQTTKSVNRGVKTNNVTLRCVDWYTKVTIFYEDGHSVVSQDWTYDKTVCTFVGDDSGGGGGGTSGGGTSGGSTGGGAGPSSPPPLLPPPCPSGSHSGPPVSQPCIPRNVESVGNGTIRPNYVQPPPADGGMPPPTSQTCSVDAPRVPCPTSTISIPFNGPKVDPKKETKCFDKSQPAKVTIYVQQPTPNTRDMIGTNSVGHTFVGITQGGITRSFGFYPDSPTASVLSSQNSEIHDNSGELYHVSISINVTPAQLTNVLNYINNYPQTYTLSSYNCTDFAIATAGLAGLRLPATTGKTNQMGFTFTGRNPGDLGQDIRNMTLPAGAVRSQGESHAPNKSGTCP